MFGMGIGELLIILAIIMLIFGASRIPKLAGGLGSGIRNFKEGLKGAAADEDQSGPKGEIDSKAG